jgi:hypothetical protein
MQNGIYEEECFSYWTRMADTQVDFVTDEEIFHVFGKANRHHVSI